ncbi:MAG: hypothetical protein FWD97_06650 [Defluviitaleaceae bacterium]|nr:hypothetical protein [Defluviitaleaceae bacterium]
MYNIIFQITSNFSLIVVVTLLIVNRVRERKMLREVFTESNFTIRRTRKAVESNIVLVVLALLYLYALSAFGLDETDFMPLVALSTVLALAGVAQTFYRIFWRCTIKNDEIIHGRNKVINLTNVTKVKVGLFRRIIFFEGDEGVLTIPLNQIDHTSHNLLIDLLKSRNIQGYESLPSPLYGKKYHGYIVSISLFIVQAIFFYVVVIDGFDFYLNYEWRWMFRDTYTTQQVMEAYLGWHRILLRETLSILAATFVLNAFIVAGSRLASRNIRLPIWAAVASCIYVGVFSLSVIWHNNIPDFISSLEYDMQAVESGELQQKYVLLHSSDLELLTQVSLSGVSGPPPILFSLNTDELPLLLTQEHRLYLVNQLENTEAVSLILYYTPIHRVIVEIGNN